MTAFAGVFSSRGPVPAAVRESLARHISRHPQEDVREDSHDRLHVVSFDAGLWRADGVHRDADGTFTIVAGDPVLHATGASRTDDVARLHAELRGKRNDALAGARGAFALVHYAPDRHELRLATDRGGIRPVYVCERDGLVFFATALRVLESIEALPLTVDLRGLANRLTFRTYLGTRTPYVGVTRLQAAETCRIDDSGTVYERFFDWTAIPESDAPLDVLAETAHSLFFDAVASRVRADSSAVSLLSGGLDSRFIVAELRRLEADVRTLNFSPVGTLDQVLSARFAEAAGTTHGEYPLPEGATAGDLSDWISSVRPRTGIEEDPCIARPGVVWHGFDGSFSIGYVHMPETQVRLLREDRVADAIAEDYRVRSLTGWANGFRREFRETIADGPRAAYAAALAQYSFPDPARSRYAVHLLEEIRGMLDGLHENIDVRRVEYLMPFADADLLAHMFTVPVDACVEHAFYMRMFAHAPAFARKTPWQAYPGHTPCPLPQPDLNDQWTGSGRDQQNRRRWGLDKIRAIRRDPFPLALMRRRTLAMAGLRHRLGRGDFNYAFDRIALVQACLAAAGGRYADAEAPARLLPAAHEKAPPHGHAEALL